MMMNRAAAEAYGKQIGVRYYVKNTRGGLYGGYTTLEAAQEAKKRFETEDRKNPFTKGATRFMITEAK